MHIVVARVQRLVLNGGSNRLQGKKRGAPGAPYQEQFSQGFQLFQMFHCAFCLLLLGTETTT